MTDLIATGICPAALILGLGWWTVSAMGRMLGRRFVEDPTEDDEPVDEITQELPILIPAGFTMFRGGLVHIHCVGPYLRSDAPPCAECAVHLDHVLTGAS